MLKDRVSRIIKLLVALHAERSLSVRQMADMLGVARRTVFRDLEVLQQAGVSFAFDRQTRRYRIEECGFVGTIQFSLDECLSLMFMTHKLLEESWVPDASAACRAALKLESALHPKLREAGQQWLAGVDVKLPPVSSTDGLGVIFELLHSAVAERRKVHVQYEPHAKPACADVWHPYRLAFLKRAWYVIAFSEAADSVRTFKVERIAQCRAAQQLFVMDRPFDLGDYLGNAWQMIAGSPRAHVKIRFSAQVAGSVEEVMWHKTQTTRRLADGGLLFEVDVDGIGEITWWIMGYGDQAEVLEPPELRQRILDKARRMSGIYQAACEGVDRG